MFRAALRRVSADPTSPTDDDWAALLGADGDELDELRAVADSARRSVTDPDALTCSWSTAMSIPR